MLIPVVIYAKKDSFLLEAINEKIEAIQSTGLINKWHLENIDKKFLRDGNSDLKAFSFEQLLGCFEILLYGLAACLIIFFIEHVTYRVRKYLSQRVNRVLTI